MNENDFIAAADRTLATIGDALDRALEPSDLDVDWSINEGILEIECPDGSKLIINRHAANREIWVAARAGGFHFRSDRGQWRDLRGGGELAETLGRLLHEQAGLVVEMPALAATN